MSTFAYDFNSQVLSGVSGISPVPLTYSLSGPTATQTPTQTQTNTVVLSTCGTSSGKRVYGLAFNALTSEKLSSFVTLSAATGTSFKVDTGHNGKTFALLFTDGSFSYFTVTTASGLTAVQTLTAGGFNISFPEQRRLWNLEI